MAHDIAHELDINASPDAVFDAITTQVGLSGWLTDDCFAEPQADSILELGFDGRTRVLSLRIDQLDRPALVHWVCLDGPDEWRGTTIAFRIQPHASGGTTLRFWHGGWEYEDGELPRASFTWAQALDRLRQRCEAGA